MSGISARQHSVVSINGYCARDEIDDRKGGGASADCLMDLSVVGSPSKQKIAVKQRQKGRSTWVIVDIRDRNGDIQAIALIDR